jgi:hypothetical protein
MTETGPMARAHDDFPRTEISRHPSREELLAPRTQIVADRDAYLGQGRNDVGRRIADDQIELFVTAEVAQSLQQEFALHAPEFIALHDVGTSASLRLLASLAGAAGARVQRLSVRRQGHGVAMAVLQFVEIPLADGTLVRVYSTDVNADSQARSQIARVLLAYSHLGVLMVGEMPPHALTAQLAPLHEAILHGNWPNRDLLLVPLGSGTALAAQGAQLSSQSAVAVHVTPHAARPKHVWTFVSGAWNRLHDLPNGEHTLPTELARAVPKPKIPSTEATTQSMELDPLPGFATRTLPAATPMPVPGGMQWQAYVERCLEVRGAISGCVFDTHSKQALAYAGSMPAADRLAQQGSALLVAMSDVTRALGLGPARAEAAISTPNHHLVLRPIPGHPGVALHLVLSANGGNLTLAKMQLERIDPPR